MIKRRFILFLLISGLMAVSCTQDDLSIEALNNDQKTVTLKVSVEGQAPTKVGFDESGKFYWSTKDQIGVTTTESNGYFSPLELKDVSGNTNATFKGQVKGDITQYAIYPYRSQHNVYQGTLSYHFPSSYTYSQIDTDFFSEENGNGNSFNMPMWGKLEGSNIFMRHLGGVLCIKIEQLPIDHQLSDTKSSYLEIRTKGKRINGDYSADLNTAEPVLSVLDTPNSNKQTVKIFFNNDQKNRSGVFYVPVPIGQYDEIIIGVSDGYVIEEYNMGAQTIGRRTLKRLVIENGQAPIDPEEIAKWANQTFWVEGIHNPPFEQWGLYDAQYKIPGLTWKREYGWYDCNKKNPTGPEYDDQNLCWAATASNLIYWWLDRNQKNIERYAKYTGPKIYNNSTDCEVFDFFKTHFEDKGNWTDQALNWFFRGERPSAGLISSNHKGFFSDVFSKNMVRVSSAWTLSEDLKTAFLNKESIGISYRHMDGYHAITVWGASFDENGDVCTLYVVDNNDIGAEEQAQPPMLPGKLCPAGIFPMHVGRDSQGLYRLKNLNGEAKIEIQGLQYLSTHEKEWEEYFKNHPN